GGVLHLRVVRVHRLDDVQRGTELLRGGGRGENRVLPLLRALRALDNLLDAARIGNLVLRQRLAQRGQLLHLTGELAEALLGAAFQTQLLHGLIGLRIRLGSGCRRCGRSGGSRGRLAIRGGLGHDVSGGLRRAVSGQGGQALVERGQVNLFAVDGWRRFATILACRLAAIGGRGAGIGSGLVAGRQIGRRVIGCGGVGSGSHAGSPSGFGSNGMSGVAGNGGSATGEACGASTWVGGSPGCGSAPLTIASTRSSGSVGALAWISATADAWVMTFPRTSASTPVNA